jgi:hypothetical protein
MNWWEEALYGLQKQPLPQRPRTIPQTPPEQSDTVDDLVAQALAATKPMTPAESVEQRFGVRPGGDIGTVSRRPGPAAAKPEPSLLDLTAQQRAELVRLGNEQGRFDEHGTARAAHEQAALVQALVRDKTFDTVEDTTPRKAATTQGFAGASWWSRLGR